jgi:hypothetical protein
MTLANGIIIQIFFQKTSALAVATLLYLMDIETQSKVD